MSAFRLIIVRHGETDQNVSGEVYGGVPGPPLNEVGEKQAAAVAAALAGEEIAAVYASSMLRAQQTAAPIAAPHGLEVEVLPEIRELDLGSFGEGEGQDRAAFWETYGRWHRGEPLVRIADGETGAEVVERYTGAVRRLAARHAGRTVVIVSHGGASRLAGAALADNVDGEFAVAHVVPNTGRIELVRDDAGRWTCRRWADVTFD